MKIHFIFSLLTFVVASTNAQLITFGGTCPTVNYKMDMDLSKLSGKWYEIKRYLALYDLAGHCVTNTVTFATTANNLNIVTVNMLNSLQTAYNPSFVPAGPTNEGKYLFKYPGLEFLPMTVYILDTDYTNFMSAYACVDIFGLVKFEFAWEYSRNWLWPFSAYGPADAAFPAKNITLNNMIFLPIDQWICNPFH